VFNQGHVIASGAPEAVVQEDSVIEAYLGRAYRRPATVTQTPAGEGGGGD
jgi:ABC-type hemin transport system ATPase subunit